MANETVVKSKRASARVRRTSLTKRSRIAVRDQDPDFVYRVVNDTPGRVEELQDQDWEVDTNTSSGQVEQTSEGVKAATSPGSVKKVHVGNGQYGIVMRKRRDYYDEDVALKHAENDKYIQQIKQDVTQSGGKLDLSRD